MHFHIIMIFKMIHIERESLKDDLLRIFKRTIFKCYYVTKLITTNKQSKCFRQYLLLTKEETSVSDNQPNTPIIFLYISLISQLLQKQVLEQLGSD